MRFSVAPGKWTDCPAGVAHFLEHKMFDMPNGVNAMQMFESFGGQPNAFTSHSTTAYHFSCVGNFEENLRVLMETVSTPYFTSESVEKEKGIIGQEIRMVEDSPGSRVFENMLGMMFPGHPAGTCIAGTVESISGISAYMMYECFHAFYDPSNMCLCVVGDVDPESVRRIASSVLELGATSSGKGSSSQVRPKVIRDYGSGGKPLILLKEQKMEVSVPLFCVGAPTAPPREGVETLFFELVCELAMEVLVGQSSPLHSRLYSEGIINKSFEYGYYRVPERACLLCIGESSDPQRVREELLREVRRVRSEGLDLEAFERLKRSLLGERLRSLDETEELCRLQAAAHFRGANYFDFYDCFERLTPEAALDALACLEEQSTVLSVVK
jgi:predicted Zn-dependent peptidase